MGRTDLPDLINALKSQSYPCDHVEYLLINNNSCDRTEEILNLAAANSIKNHGIKIVALTENTIQSSYAARNQGIKASKGDILIFTDADCRPLSNWIEEMVSCRLLIPKSVLSLVNWSRFLVRVSWKDMLSDMVSCPKNIY